MIYHVQYNSGNGWQGINGECVYITADTAAEAIERVKPIIADRIQSAERDRIADVRTYNSETVLYWQECYETAEAYRYRIRTIETDGRGNISPSDWKEI